MKLATALLVFALATFNLPLATAQTGFASISGRVSDHSGAVIQKADVTLKNLETGDVLASQTNTDGVYNFPSVKPGNYVMRVQKQGFRSVDVTGLTLYTQDQLARNFSLEVGSASESVTVTGGETNDSPAISMIVTHDFVEGMPLNGRSFTDLLSLAPGAVANNGFYSIDGQREDANNYTVDGVSANTNVGLSLATGSAFGGNLPALTAVGTTQSLLSVDAMQEFKVETSGYGADQGRQPGGQVEITSRSGTNQFHGSASDYLRNTIFDANNWFLNNAGLPRQADHENDFGGTFGGPVIIPHIYNGKDKTFAFANYEGLRFYLPAVDTEDVPTSTAIQNSAPGVQPFLEVFPTSNGPVNPDGLTAQSTLGYSNRNNVNSESVRVDHSMGRKVHLFGRFFDTPSIRGIRQQPATEWENEVSNNLGLTVGATWSLSQNIVNDARFNYTRSLGSLNNSQDTFGGGTPVPLTLFMSPVSVAAESYQVGTYFFTGTSLDNINPQYTYQNLLHRSFNLLDSFTWTHGAHSIKLGEDYRILYNEQGQSNPGRSIEFDSIPDVQQGTAFLFEFSRPNSDPGYTNLSLYAMDHWKLGSRLTLDYGLRWELNPPPSIPSNEEPFALSSPTTNLNTATLAPLGTPPYHTVYTAFAPRLGFAWRAVQAVNHPVVIRGGIGMFYDTGQAGPDISLGDDTPRFNIVTAQNVPVPLPSSYLAPIPILTSPTMPPYYGIGLVEPDLKVPYTTSWSLSVDIGVSVHNTITVSYLGNKGKDLLFNASESDSNSEFSSAEFITNGASSDYNAMQIQDSGTVANSLQIIGSYTWAHAIDNLSSDQASATVPLRGNADFDIRQVLNLALNYHLPSVNSARPLRAFTKGWVLGDRFQAETGYPFGVIQGYYNSLASAGINLQQQIFPDLVAGVPVYLHGVPRAPGGWELNQAAFSEVPLNPDGSPVHQGSLGRNALYGPAYWNLNTALQRSFSLGEKVKLDCRVEAFNIFNHANFTNIDTSLSDATFGQALSLQGLSGYQTGAPRQLQFSLKLSF